VETLGGINVDILFGIITINLSSMQIFKFNQTAIAGAFVLPVLTDIRNQRIYLRPISGQERTFINAARTNRSL
jgi:hypothetical protein